MTDNEIINALECCGIKTSCENCPYHDTSLCQDAICKDALALINRQKAEIERYEKENNEKFNKWMLLDERTKERYAELYEEAKGVVRAEAIKEFAEKLKDMAFMPLGTLCAEMVVTERCINNLVKEMVGDGK